VFRIFVDRESELEFLEKAHKKRDLQVIIIYGRRRVGKTELIKEFVKNKDALYFLADKRGTEKNLERFVRIVQEHYRLPPLRLETFDECFKFITERSGKKKTVVVVDEFSYLIEKDPALGSVFQLIIDEILKDANLMLILCGSSMSMMERGVLSYKSPLYGRRTGQIKLKPMEFRTLKAFFPRYSTERLIETYSVLGGVPAYLALFDQGKDVLGNMKDTFFAKEHLFYEEPEIILKEELREPRVYFNLLEAMAHGKTRLTDIANRAGINAKDASAYVNSLMGLDMVEKDYPVTERKPRSKRALYHIKDNFFTFWFRFVVGNREKIERREYEILLDEVANALPGYVGKTFEKVCVEFLMYAKASSYTRIGRWWGIHRDERTKARVSVEIDIVALNERTKEIMFAECKWQDRKLGRDVPRSLLGKASHVDWNKGKRKERFALFSKSGFDRACKEFARKHKIMLFDLKDIEKMLK